MLRCRYLAPEYAQSGQITEKTDVYSFGVVLIELVTGRKAVDLNRPKGQQCLTEWVFLKCCLYILLLITSLYSFVTLRTVYKIHSTNICPTNEGAKQVFLFF